MEDLNKYAIVPKGPFPDIQEGAEQDFSKLKPGGVMIEAIERYASTLSLS
jgi:hypothetical protein